MRRESVTTADIARHCGVSWASVSYVLNGKSGTRISDATQQRIHSAAAELGYRGNAAATALRTGRTHSIGLVSSIHRNPMMADLSRNYARNLFAELSLAAARAGMGADIFVDSLGLPLDTAVLMDGRVDGVIFFAQGGAPEWVEAVFEMGLPCVEIDPSWGRYQVHQNNVGGTYAAVDHLLALGHRRIGHWRGPDDIFAAGERARAFHARMDAAGIPERDQPVVTTAQEFARALSRPDHPTAFFIFMDTIAVEAPDCIHEAGLKVPGDISLIGYDNDLRATTMRPALTTVQNPLTQMADAAVTLLKAQVRQQEILTEREVVPTHLVVRNSTAPPTDLPTRQTGAPG